MKRILPLLGLLVIAGCGDAEEAATTTDTGAATAPAIDGSQYLLDAEPEGAMDVIAARKDAKDDAEVVIVGRIGGKVDPWVDGMAVFNIADTSATPCNEIPGDKCQVPWDYCCETDLGKKILLVEFHGDDARPLPAGAKGLFNVKELDTVVIQGKAKRDADGNLTVLASKMFVRK